jgi:hypothetical protein
MIDIAADTMGIAFHDEQQHLAGEVERNKQLCTYCLFFFELHSTT